MIRADAPVILYSLPVPQLQGSHAKLTSLVAGMYGGIVVQADSGRMAQSPCAGVADQQLAMAIDTYDPDLVVVLGDFYLQWEICAEKGVPFIVSQHDTHTITGVDIPDAMWENERAMFGAASGVIFANELHEKWLTEKYHLTIPTMTAYPKPMAADMMFEPLPKKPGTLVYAGGLVPHGRLDKMWGYKYLVPVFEQYIEDGWEVHLYSNASPYIMDEYIEAGCVNHGYAEYSDLYREMSQYEAGFVGYNPDADLTYVETAIPGKMFDYTVAGIPTLLHHAGWAEEMAVEAGFGATSRPLPVITDELKRAHLMESYTDQVCELVDSI